MDSSNKGGNKREVIKDLSDSYNEFITELLDDIKEIKEQIDKEDNSIIYLNQKLNDLFMKIYPKMVNVGMTKEIILQKKMNSSFIRNKHKFWKYKYQEGSGNKYIIGKTELYFRARDMLSERELKLNVALEQIGLTSKDKIKNKRLR